MVMYSLFYIGLDDTTGNDFLSQVFRQSQRDYEEQKQMRKRFDEDIELAIKMSLEESATPRAGVLFKTHKIYKEI